MPEKIWGWRCTTVVAMLATLALATAATIGPAPPSWAATAGMAGLVGYPLVLASAAFAYVHWRLTDNEISAWLCMGLAAVGVNGLAVGGAVTARPELLTEATTWLVLVELTVTLGLFVLVSMAAAGEPVLDPMALGLVVGVSLGLVFATAITRLDEVVLPGQVLAALGLGCLAINVALARYLVAQTTMPSWCALRLALGVALLGVGDIALAVEPGATGSVVVRLVGTLGGAVLLFCAAMALLRSGIEEATEALGAASGRAALAEEQHDTERARMHEIGSTFAGIASASRLISAPSMTIPDQKRTSLERMLLEEMARLERMLGGQRGVALEFDLDTVLHQQVLSHQARGHAVVWTPSGARVTGDPDDVAEVVDVLLDNAAKHGAGVAEVSVSSLDGVVEVSVVDEGSGVCDSLVGGRLFDWGRKGAMSQGQGIGLNIARGLAERQGGYLMLGGTELTGTTFVLGLLAGDDDRLLSGENDDAVIGNGTR